MRTCNDCLLQQQHGGVCPVFNEKVSSTDSTCRKYIGHDSDKCDFCGALMPGKAEIVLMENDEIRLACGKCGNALGTCATCAQAKLCDFETNPIQIPKQVQKVVRQGNMQMQTIIHNPEREKETCMKGCSCWDAEECICVRQIGSCKAWRYE